MSNPQESPGRSDELPPLPRLPVGRYRHYKGNYYWVLGVARHSETLEPMVVYRPIPLEEKDEEFWVRPFEMFTGTVDLDGHQIPRFVRVGD